MSESKTAGEMPCTHEWYLGHCVHCDVSVKSVRARESSELLNKWQLVAMQTRLSRADIDVSTPEKYLTAEIEERTRVMDRISKLREVEAGAALMREALEKAHALGALSIRTPMKIDEVWRAAESALTTRAGRELLEEVEGLRRECAELAASLPLSTNRTRYQAREMCGEVLRHDDGNGVSHGCVQAVVAHEVVDTLIAEKNSVLAKLSALHLKVKAAEGMAKTLKQITYRQFQHGHENYSYECAWCRRSKNDSHQDSCGIASALTAWQEANKE